MLCSSVCRTVSPRHPTCPGATLKGSLLMKIVVFGPLRRTGALASVQFSPCDTRDRHLASCQPDAHALLRECPGEKRRARRWTLRRWMITTWRQAPNHRRRRPARERDASGSGALTEATGLPLPAMNCYPPQNAKMAFCSAGTPGNPRAAAAALRPRNCRASAETLRP